ncbi:MAG TPA: NAD(P)-dependent oxidoreductase [Longimicrobiaceae bacterium]|nr:NAD(P)-dependent oxidoreductase [Longimicrobiaceae bacterium]
MRIFVTGSTGVVGRRLVPLLVGAGHQVTAVARDRAKAERVEKQGAAAAVLSLFDPDAVAAAVRGHEVVVNLATHIPAASRAFLPGAWRENDRIRREASRILADAALAAGCGRFVQESITLTYPDSGEEWITEERPVRPARYVRSVLDAEAQAERVTAAGATGVVLRFALFYGPDSGHTLDTIRFVRKGMAPTFGSADGFVSSISTDDAAAAVVAALGVPAGVYNVADDEPVRRREYFESLARTLGVPAPTLPPAWTTFLAGSLGETIARSQRVSNGKLKRAGEWAPRYPSVREGWQAVCGELGLAGYTRPAGAGA